MMGLDYFQVFELKMNITQDQIISKHGLNLDEYKKIKNS